MNIKGDFPAAGANGDTQHDRDSEESREAKVERLRKAVANGTYFVAAEDIAEKMFAAAWW